MSDRRYRIRQRWYIAAAVDFTVAIPLFLVGWWPPGIVMTAAGLFASWAAQRA